MNYNQEKNTRAFEMITMLAIAIFLIFIFIKFLYF
jgi:predicted nucleic acid-binding Zn ribbon protein